MKPYMLIQGSSQAIEAFEQKVAAALEQGYSLAGEMVTHPLPSEVKFYQPVMLEEEDYEDDDYEEEDEEDED